MRTQALACAIFAATALSPSLVIASPLPAFAHNEAEAMSAVKKFLPSSPKAARDFSQDMHDIMPRGHQPVVFGGTLQPPHALAARTVSSLEHLEQTGAHVVESRDEPRRGVVGTAVMPANRCVACNTCPHIRAHHTVGLVPETSQSGHSTLILRAGTPTRARLATSLVAQQGTRSALLFHITC